MPDRVRLDKWLWAARFFRTRGLAREAIEGGKKALARHGKDPADALRFQMIDQNLPAVPHDFPLVYLWEG